MPRRKLLKRIFKLVFCAIKSIPKEGRKFIGIKIRRNNVQYEHFTM